MAARSLPIWTRHTLWYQRESGKEDSPAWLETNVAIRHISDRPRETLFAQDHTSTMESPYEAVTDTANRITLQSGQHILARCLRSSLRWKCIRGERDPWRHSMIQTGTAEDVISTVGSRGTPHLGARDGAFAAAPNVQEDFRVVSGLG